MLVFEFSFKIINRWNNFFCTCCFPPLSLLMLKDGLHNLPVNVKNYKYL